MLSSGKQEEERTAMLIARAETESRDSTRRQDVWSPYQDADRAHEARNILSEITPHLTSK